MINYRRIKVLFERTVNDIVNVLSFMGVIAGYFLFYFHKKRHPFRLQEMNDKKIYVLANGPSLKDILTNIQSRAVPDDKDIIAMNFFALTPEFCSLKPVHYCFADPMFFKKNHRYEDVKELFHILNEKVDWGMNIYMNPSKIRKFLDFSGINNPRINIIACGGYPYNGFRKLNRWSYRLGLSTPPVSSVVHLAIWIAINSGYREIELYGVDHTFYSCLKVNSDNVVCKIDNHFYDDEKLKPILKSDNMPYTMYEYISHTACIFKSHEALADYALSVGSSIINCTPSSLIDCYPRKKDIDEDVFFEQVNSL